EQFELAHRIGLARSHQGHEQHAIEAFDDALAVAVSIGPAYPPAAYVHIARAESLRRPGRRADAEAALRAAIAAAEHAPLDSRERIAKAARRALDALRPSSAATGAAGATGPASGPTPAPGQPSRAPLDRAELKADDAAFDAVLAELDALVGLAAVKAEVRRLAELLRIATMRRAEGLKTVQVSLHLVFEGGAGTGKTTVARLFGRLYESLGLLATDTVVEVTREDLVSGYVGQTAAKTAAAVDSALDGVLFLDEAYGLVRPGSEGDFGPEAVVELLKRMEDDRSRLAVIAAGYSHEMTEFLASNSGFRSRFGETIHFEDYGPAELVQIFEKFAADADYVLAVAAREELQRVMERLHAARDRYFGNARTARNLFDDVVAHQAERLLKTAGKPDRQALMELMAADVQAASAERPQSTPAA
ncbi:MAG: stage sporulation protein, partial [bacterium]